ncbi:MAG: head-tail adaptor protein [Caulobacteraceae bacterium]
MTAVRMRESVKFQRRAASASGISSTPGAWKDLCGPFRARLQPLNGREDVLAQKLSGVQPFALTVRYCAAVAALTTQDRAVNARTGVPYDIASIQNTDERQMYLNMLVKAGKPSQG